MIRNISRLDLFHFLRPRASPEELDRLLCLIESTNFAWLPNNWSPWGEVRSLLPGRDGRSSHYLFYNPHNERSLRYNEAWNLVCASRARLQTGHPVASDFKELALFDLELAGKVGVGSGMYNQVIEWDDEVPVDDNQVMIDAHACSRLPEIARLWMSPVFNRLVISMDLRQRLFMEGFRL